MRGSAWQELIEIIRTFVYKPGCEVPEVLLMSPPHLCKTDDEEFAFYFEHAIAESMNLGRQYAKLAGVKYWLSLFRRG